VGGLMCVYWMICSRSSKTTHASPCLRAVYMCVCFVEARHPGRVYCVVPCLCFVSCPIDRWVKLCVCERESVCVFLLPPLGFTWARLMCCRMMQSLM
jgi:hypothetical protein